ncbi:hypothetical protein L1049_020754 [Liquidambar formosana]|uniref:Uncharacterized protein n=1 Tax=Liquidambar formosana TaxID=63359 RepID=A0AAP0SEF1_LIQFO
MKMTLKGILVPEATTKYAAEVSPGSISSIVVNQQVSKRDNSASSPVTRRESIKVRERELCGCCKREKQTQQLTESFSPVGESFFSVGGMGCRRALLRGCEMERRELLRVFSDLKRMRGKSEGCDCWRIKSG